MILAISIFIIVMVLSHPYKGKLYEKTESYTRVNFYKILFIPSAIYVIWFVLNYYNIV